MQQLTAKKDIINTSVVRVGHLVTATLPVSSTSDMVKTVSGMVSHVAESSIQFTTHNGVKMVVEVISAEDIVAGKVIVRIADHLPIVPDEGGTDPVDSE